MVTKVKLHSDARKTILRAVNLINDTVRLTLGVEGASVLIHRSFNRGSRITNDGVTVAKCIEPKDEFENLVATAFKEGASKTGQTQGDGTTSTTVIAAKLVNDAFSRLKDGDKGSVQLFGADGKEAGVIALRNHLMAQVPFIKESIEKETKKVKSKEELANIAFVALNGNRELAETVSEMVWKTGTEGFISLTDGFSGKIETEVIEGARFPMKIAAPRFLTNPERYEMVAEDCECVVTNHKIDSIGDFASFWNGLKRHKLLIFAPGFSEEVLVAMVKIMSPRQNPDGSFTPSAIKIFPVCCPSLGSEDLTPHNFNDLADFVDAAFIDKNKGDKLKDVKEYHLGFVEKCTVKSAENREDAILLGGKGMKNDKVKKRIEMLRGQLEKTTVPEHKKLIQKRIASLAGAGGLIRVGAATEAEALPLKHKIEDAVFACQSALKSGFVRGGGLCLKEIADTRYKDDSLIRDALSAPYHQIQENAGYEVKIGKDIIDPAGVVIAEVVYGFGVAANLITCKAIIAEFDDRDPRDGYQLIADALYTHARLYAKREGLFQAGLGEAEKEKLQKDEALIAQEGED